MRFPILTVAMWTARVLGVLLLVLIAQLAIGEGVPNPLHGLLRENLLTLAFVAMIVGQIVAWKWEVVGELLIVGNYIVWDEAAIPTVEAEVAQFDFID